LVKSVKFNHDAQQNILSIEVRFENTNVAVTAYNEVCTYANFLIECTCESNTYHNLFQNHGWLKRVRIETEIISCTETTETITSGAPGAVGPPGAAGPPGAVPAARLAWHWREAQAGTVRRRHCQG
jgi:hypothetical protein